MSESPRLPGEVTYLWAHLPLTESAGICIQCVSRFNKWFLYMRKLSISWSNVMKEEHVQLSALNCSCGYWWPRYFLPFGLYFYNHRISEFKGTYLFIYIMGKARVINLTKKPIFFLFCCAFLIAFPHKLPKWDDRPFAAS